MGIDSIFSKSWKEFTKNIIPSMKVSFWAFILPLIVLLIIGMLLLIPFISGLFNPTIYQNQGSGQVFKSIMGITGDAVLRSCPDGNCSNPNISSGIVNFFIVFFILFILMGLILFAYQLILLYLSVYNEKGGMSVSQAWRGARKFFWRLMGLIALIILIIFLLVAIPVLIGIILILLFKNALFITIPLFILIIFGVIALYFFFAIRWSLSTFVLLRENTGVTEAMKRSSIIVKGRWWKVFGYLILFSLISSGISFAASVIIQLLYFMFVGIFIFSALLGGTAVLCLIFFFLAIVLAIYGLIMGIASLALFLLVKNLYLEVRNEKRR